MSKSEVLVEVTAATRLEYKGEDFEAGSKLKVTTAEKKILEEMNAIEKGDSNE